MIVVNWSHDLFNGQRAQLDLYFALSAALVARLN
jgi:hypothetical protein